MGRAAINPGWASDRLRSGVLIPVFAQGFVDISFILELTLSKFLFGTCQ